MNQKLAEKLYNISIVFAAITSLDNLCRKIEYRTHGTLLRKLISGG